MSRICKLSFVLLFCVVLVATPTAAAKTIVLDQTSFLAATLAPQSPAAESPKAADLSSDSRVHWLRKHAIQVRTVNPADEDFRDLKPLKKVIGDARIVMLGEISHGDGTTFLAKSRLIKFLHQQMNFDVLVFESSFYDVSKVWESIEQGQEPVAAVQRGVFAAWSRSPQVKDLFDYVGRSAKSPRPLALAGFDLQPFSRSKESLLSELDALVAQLGITSEVTTPGSPARELALNLFAGKYNAKGLPAPDAAARKAFYDGLDTLRDRLASATTASNEPQTSFWRQVVLSSLKSYAELTWWDREHGFGERGWAMANMREKQNADNLLWLADHQYRGKKIVVWGATMHLLRQAPTIEPNINPKDPQQPYTGLVSMGELVWQRIGPQAFVIGFTCYEGSNGFGDPKDKDGSFINAVKKDQDPSIELEELLNAVPFDYALVDFRKPAAHGEWLKESIISRPLASQGMRAVWPNVVDAMFFIRVMEPNGATNPARGR
jgi:erythromycin esterase